MNQGLYHAEQFRRLGQLDDIEKAVEYSTIALALIPEDDPNLPILLDNLGAYLIDRFQRLGELADLEKSIEYKSRALTLTPDDHSDMPTRLTSIAKSHGIRFQRLGELADNDKAIEYLSIALTLTPDDDPDLPPLLLDLGTCHGDLFQRAGELGDLEKAIGYNSRALALTPDGCLHLPLLLENLGSCHGIRYKRLGERDDIDKSVEYKSMALALTSGDDPHLSSRLVNLAASHSHRYTGVGELGDLEKAIAYISRALILTPKNHPDLPTWLMTLGTSHNLRFGRLGELDDLDKAVEYPSMALTLIPNNHPRLPVLFANIGAAYNERYGCLGELDDLEKALEYQTRALALTSNDHPYLPSRLINLATFHNNRFQRLGELDDTEKAIGYMSMALTLIPDDHPDLLGLYMNLAAFHNTRFHHLGNSGDLKEAIEYSSRAITLTPDGHLELSKEHHGLARYQVKYSETTGDLSCLQDALHSFRKASQSLVGTPNDRFEAALEWAQYASRHSSLNCIEAYQTAIDLLPQFIWLGATTAQRYQDLDKAKDLAVSAASAAIRSSKYRLALEWMEHARCVVWNQSLMLRSPLDQLRSFHPDLAARLQTVSNQLHHAGAESRAARELSDLITPEQAAQQHRRLAGEYDNLLAEARKLPGFEDFLKPMKAAGLVRAAQNGPIVVVKCNTDGYDALLIQPGQDEITHIPLLNFTVERAQHDHSEIEKSVRSMRLRERGERRPVIEPEDDYGSLLKILWYGIVKPVLDFLGYTNNASKDSLPHITWCPTGVVSFLPLHAAGDYDEPGSRVFNYVISSYTPTLTALIASTPNSLSPNSRVLAIGQEATPGHTRLPGTAQELASVQAHVQDIAQYTQLVNDQATTTAVLNAMEQHDWVHLACHAHQNVNDATKSGFFLHDDTLDLAAINRRSFKNKGLAYLSACQTATGDGKLPDEAIHLASGMLMAGYTSVIATMWSVHDADAPLVADKVYAQLMKDRNLGNGEAGKALHNAVAELRDKVGEKEFVRWVPYIHVGS
ncbi:unnamed protein product [Rhizoctonia solani]|uniref:CHAT domain-containing protein n=1 Tax=Rhizoctonia solani TaxID=456999 RepID=A0A8H3H4E6_9AGAM|nr:unnamed protein product [Rhizoctonia solani]